MRVLRNLLAGIGTAALAGLLITHFAYGEACFPKATCDLLPTQPQTITSGATIKDDACGGVKLVTAGSALSTSSTIPFPAPSTNNSGCVMLVCNTTTNTITIKHVAAFFLTTGGSDVALAQNTCVSVLSTGAGGVWIEAGTSGTTLAAVS